MPDHTGRRRKQSGRPIGRFAALAVSLAAVGVFVSLPPPQRAAVRQPPLQTAPAWTGPATVATSGALADGAPYTPRLFVTPEISIGLAPTPDGAALRLVLRGAGGAATELRRLAVSRQPEFDGFAVAGDTLLWAESQSPAGPGAGTTLWRGNWRTRAEPVMVTASTGDPNFLGGQYDLVVHAGRVYWASGVTRTDIRSVPINGGAVTTQHLAGAFGLSAWPWAVSVDGGRGRPVQLFNYDTGATATLPTEASETITCGAVWCRVGVIADDALIRLELVRPDGSGRRRIAGSEATPTIVDAALLDRYVPLATDRGTDEVGLSLYDIATGQTALVATDAANVRANGATLWWSSGAGPDLTWHALDLAALR